MTDPDEFDCNDLADVIRQHMARPRERPPKPPTPEDAALFDSLAGQTGTLTNARHKWQDGVTVETITDIAIGQPVLGPIEERNPE